MNQTLRRCAAFAGFFACLTLVAFVAATVFMLLGERTSAALSFIAVFVCAAVSFALVEMAKPSNWSAQHAYPRR
jgi:hypothetical protein